MFKTFKYRIRTSSAVEQKLEAVLAACCQLYNAALEERRSAYQVAGKSVGYVEQANQLPEIKQVCPELNQIHSQVLQNVLNRVDVAFDRFFRRVNNGQRSGYPRFKALPRYDSFTFPQGGWTLKGDKLRLSKIGSMRLRLSRPLEGRIKTLTIKRGGDKWYAVYTCEVEAKPLAPTGLVKAVDVGLESFLIDQNSYRVENPKYFKELEEKLAGAQRQMSKKKKDSSHWKRAKARVVKIHQKIAAQRRDFLHKLSTQIIGQNDIIFFELLNIAGMLKNHYLAKSISDAAWGMFIRMLTYKAAEAGRLALNVNPHGTSQECSGCKEKVPKGLSERWHRCPYCGLELQRDHNAARNILARGMEILQAAGLVVSAPGGLTVVEPTKGEPLPQASSLVCQAATSD